MDTVPLANKAETPPAPWLWYVLSILCIAAVTFAVIDDEPRDGRVTGYCRNQTTHAPLGHVVVSLEYDDTSASDSGDETTQSNTDVFPTDTAPAGWAQQSDSDTDDTLAGGDTTPRDHWQELTDSDGRFVFPRVPVGSYTLSTQDSDQTQTVAVSEGNTTDTGLTVAPQAPSLDFAAPSINWAPGEQPSVTLNGTTTSNLVAFQLDRVDPVLAGSTNPELLAAPNQTGDELTSDWLARPANKRTPGAAFMTVHAWTMDLTNRDRDGYFVDRVEVSGGKGAPLTPGVYRLTAMIKDPGSSNLATVWLRITKLAVIAKNWNGHVLVSAVDLITGAALSNVSVALFDQGTIPKLLSSATTTSRGLATLSTAGVAPETTVTLLAKSGDSVAGLTLDANSPGSTGDSDSDTTTGDLTGKPPLRAFIYTDRPVYRPGQTVSVKGILRHFERPAGFTIPANQTADVSVKDADDMVLYHGSVTTDSMGTWNTSFVLSPEALTGEDMITIDLAGQSTDQTFLVAAYQKPEYQAKVTFDKVRYVHGDTIHATVTGTYYYGSPVIGAKVDIEVYRGAAPDNGDQGANAGDADNSNSDGSPVLSQNLILGADGTVSVDVPTNGDTDQDDQSGSDQSTGAETYTFNVTVDDSSGRTAQTTGVTDVAQGEFDMDIEPAVQMCSPGSAVETRTTATNPNDSPRIGQLVKVSAYYDDWSNGTEQKRPVMTATAITGADGIASCMVVAKQGGLLVLQASAMDARGNTIVTTSQIWVSSDGGDLPAHYADLSLTLDRKQYKPGDTARLLINTAHPGPSALVTIEGADIYSAEAVVLRHNSTEIDLPVELAYAPSVTVSVGCIFDKQDLSAEANLTIDDPRRPLQVTIASDKSSYKPGDAVTLNVNTRDPEGRPLAAEVSVGVVDSSVYAIAPEDKRDIVSALEPEQGDVVTTTTSCATVYYGDVDKGSTDIDIRRKFPDTALWLPVLRTDALGSATCHLTLPDNLTTWHATCIGVTSETQVGRATTDFTVSKDLMVRLEMPAFLVAGDQSTVAAIANTNNTNSQTCQLALSAPGLTVAGSTRATVSVASGAPGSEAWTVTAPNAGVNDVTATASGQSAKDGVAMPLTVEPHASLRSTWQTGVVDMGAGGSSGTARIPVDLSHGSESSSVRIRITPTPAAALVAGARYLAAYPYGSADAVSSTLLANAVVSGMTGANGRAPQIVSRPDEAATLGDMTSRSLLRLYHVGNDDGGWGWFPTDGSELYSTAQALWALSVAHSAGYPIDPDVFTKAVDTCERLANHERAPALTKHPDVDSLSLATLALAELGQKKAAANSLAFLHKRMLVYPLTLDMSDRAMIALTGHLFGGASAVRAKDDMTGIWALARVTGSLYSWTASYHRGEAGVIEDDPDPAATAWVLLAAEAVDPDDSRLAGAAQWLMTNRDDDHWTDCPTTTATSLLALAGYLSRSHELQPDYVADLKINGHSLASYRVTAKSIEDPSPTLDVPQDLLSRGTNSLSIAVHGSGRCYYSVEKRVTVPVSVPSTPTLLQRLIARILHPGGTPPLRAAANGYRVKRVYVRTTSRRNFLMEDTVPKPDTEYNPKENMVVRLIIDCVRPGSRLVVEEPIPAGCRITELSGAQYTNWSNWWDYTDVRDDKIVFFIQNLTRGRHEIDYHLQAQTPGRYDVMPTTITSTADPTLYATGVAARITIDD